jgi:hypothetical protein
LPIDEAPNISHSNAGVGAFYAVLAKLVVALKQCLRAWFNGRTSAFQADGAGSIPAARSNVVVGLKLL